MPLLQRIESIVPPSERTPSSALRWGSAVATALAVAAGVWAAGAVLTEDSRTAMALTTVWFGLAGLTALVVALRWRRLALPVLGAFALSAAGLGGYLAYSSTVDRVVDEQVVVVDDDDDMAGNGAPGPTVVAKGEFRSDAHETSGIATVVEQPDGSRLLTLTSFVTDPGPDLRVYVVPEGATGVDGAVDVGALKGNKGNQQYALPAQAQLGTVVVWCRAFSVSFGSAPLSPGDMPG